MLCYSYLTDEPSAWVIIALVLFLAWGVLNIILFFKLWKACNNISRIASNFSDAGRALSWSDLLLLGRKEEAADLVVRQLLGRLNNTYELRKKIGTDDVISPSLYAPAIKEAQERLEIIGAGVIPPEISSPAAFLAWKEKTEGAPSLSPAAKN